MSCILKCMFLFCYLLEGVLADYMVFSGGMYDNTNFGGISGAYSICRQQAATSYPFMVQSAVFPFLYGASELNNWKDNNFVNLTDGRPIYTGAQLRSRTLEDLGNTITKFSGCHDHAYTSECDNCWMEKMGLGSYFPTISFGCADGGFNERVGYTCSLWTYGGNGGQAGIIYYSGGNCAFSSWQHTCSAPSYILCMWDTESTHRPTKSPTHKPSLSPTLPTSAPTKNPTVTPTVSPIINPTVSPTVSPTLSPITVTNSPTQVIVRKGSKDSIGFQFTASLGRDPEEMLASNLSVVIKNNTIGHYVMLVDCSEPHEHLIPDIEVRVKAIDEEGYAIDTLCLDYLDMSQETGTDTFEYYLTWEGRPTNIAKLSITLTKPLFPSNVTLPTDQYPFNLSFALELGDTFNRTDILIGQVLTLPEHGVLRHLGNNSLVQIGELVDGNLTYSPPEYYSNEYSTGETVTFYGELLDPDTFLYRVLETVNYTISDTGTVTIRVRNSIDPIESISGIKGTLALVPGVATALGNRIQLIDRDYEEYRIGIKFSSLDGSFVIDVNRTELSSIGPNKNGLLVDECVMNQGCEELYFAATPKYLNYLLSKMHFEAFGDAKTIGASISCWVYQPGPNGVTPENFGEVRNSHVPNITGKINLRLITAPTPPPTNLEDLATYQIFTSLLRVYMAASIMVIAACIGGMCYMCYSGLNYIGDGFRYMYSVITCRKQPAIDIESGENKETAPLLGSGRKKLKKKQCSD